MASDASSGQDIDHARMAVVLRKLLQRTRQELEEEDEADAIDDDVFLGRRTRRRREQRAMTAAPPWRSLALPDRQSNNAQQQQQQQEQDEHISRHPSPEQRPKPMPVSAMVGGGGTKAVEPNDPSSKKRKKLVYPYPGGIYGAFCEIPAVGDSDGFRQRTGFSREEFDAFYAEQGGDRGHLFKQPRNHYGEHSEEKNAQRRTIRGVLSDRDRVLCWLEMLRWDVHFDEMTTKYGPSKATFHNDFKWMTMAARSMPFLLDVRVVELALRGLFCAKS